MTTTMTAHFDGKVIVPDQPVELPVGTLLRIAVATEPAPDETSVVRDSARQFLALAQRCNLHVGTRTWTREDLYDR